MIHRCCRRFCGCWKQFSSDAGPGLFNSGQLAGVIESTLLIPERVQNQIVPSVTAQLPADLTLDPELLLSRLSYPHFEQLLESNEPLNRSFNLFVSRYQLVLPEKEEIAAFLRQAMRELGGVNNGSP